MSDLMTKLILSEHPDYDVDRYHFKFNDIVELANGAIVWIERSAITYVKAYVLKPYFGLPRGKSVDIEYSDLPYYKEGEFVSIERPVYTGLKWSAGKLVIDPKTKNKYILTSARDNGFYAIAITGPQQEEHLYIPNPYSDYVGGNN